MNDMNRPAFFFLILFTGMTVTKFFNFFSFNNPQKRRTEAEHVVYFIIPFSQSYFQLQNCIFISVILLVSLCKIL